eukprot:5645162-Prymnesium_polylepis.1
MLVDLRELGLALGDVALEPLALRLQLAAARLQLLLLHRQARHVRRQPARRRRRVRLGSDRRAVRKLAHDRRRRRPPVRRRAVGLAQAHGGGGGGRRLAAEVALRRRVAQLQLLPQTLERRDCLGAGGARQPRVEPLQLAERGRRVLQRGGAQRRENALLQRRK